MRTGEDFDGAQKIDAVLGDGGEALGFVPLKFGRRVAIYVATTPTSRVWLSLDGAIPKRTAPYAR